MDLSTSLIDIDSIEINHEETQSQFEAKKVEIEYLAHSIVNLKALLTIPIVQRTGVESYRLIAGQFEYYAFIKARELEPSLPDRIRVFIVDGKNTQPILEQVQAIKNLQSPQTIDNNASNPVLLELGNIKSIIQSLATNITHNISLESSQLKSEMIENFQVYLPKPLPPLEAFNHISDPKVYGEVVKKLEFLGNKKAKKIADRLKEISNPKHDKFATFNDVISELGKGYISKEKLLDVIDNW